MLKPTDLNLANKYRKISDYENYLTAQLESKIKDKNLLRLLIELMNTPSGKKVDVEGINNVVMSEIKNYYAECLGPILIARYKLFPAASITSSSECFYSGLSNETLYDVLIKNNNNLYKISNKQLKASGNVLKPGDVIDLIEKNPALKAKWSNKQAFKAFKILHDQNVISGPISVVSKLWPNKSPMSTTQLTKLISQMSVANDVVISDPPAALIRMVEKDPAAAANFKLRRFKLGGSVVNYLFEKILVDITKYDKSFNDLYLDSTNGNVYFFKFDINTNGNVEYLIYDPKTSGKTAMLRSKQGVERRSSSSGKLKLDKLGFAT